MNTKTKSLGLLRVASIGALAVGSASALAFADATSSAVVLGNAVGSFMDTLTTISVTFLANSTLVGAMVIAGLVFGVLYWIKGKFF